MTISSVKHLARLVTVGVALCGVGCALPAGEGETGQSSADLAAQPAARETNPITGDLSSAQNKPVSVVNNAVLRNAPMQAQILSGGGTGGDDQGPKPNPWKPTPEDDGSNTGSGTNTGTGGGGSAAASK